METPLFNENLAEEEDTISNKMWIRFPSISSTEEES